MSEKRIFHVTRGEIETAQLAIKLAGGEDKVDPLVVRIAHAERTRKPALDESTSREAS